MSNNFDDPSFATPITQLLEGKDTEILTKAARELREGDLVALAWKNNTSRTEKLGVRDLLSIQEAFAKHSFTGSSTSQVVGGGCCCTCTPACCCTAVSVADPTSS